MENDFPLGPKILSIDDILNCPDLEERVVPAPKWGGSVRIRSFTKRQQQDIRRRATVGGDIDGDRLEMLMFLEGVIEPQFTEEQYGLLEDKAAGVIDTILKEIMAISGFTPDEVDKNEGRFPKR